jgi:hypothetical protein
MALAAVLPALLPLDAAFRLPVDGRKIAVAPVRRVSVLEPEDLRRDVGGHVLDDRHARHL